MTVQEIAAKLQRKEALNGLETDFYNDNAAEIDALWKGGKSTNAAVKEFKLSEFIPVGMEKKTIRPSKANSFAAGAAVLVKPDFSVQPTYEKIEYKTADGGMAEIGFVSVLCDTEKGKIRVQFNPDLTIKQGVEYEATVENVSKNGKRHVLSVS